MTYTLEQLQAGEQQALTLRNEYKNKLSIRPPLTGNRIIFPPIHIHEDNDMLRYGMCWLYNGFAIVTPEHGLIVDPGVDFAYRRLMGNYPISWCDSMIITHQHIDHSGGASIFLEWLLRARKMINIFATKDALDEGNIPYYYLGKNTERAMHKVHILEGDKDYELDNALLHTIPLYHGIACYGFSTNIGGKKIVHISDTGYAININDQEGQKQVGKDQIVGKPAIAQKHEDLKQAINGADIAIINIEQLEYGKNSFTHLCAWDIIDLVKDNGVKQLIVSHLNPCGQYTTERIQGLQNFIQDQSGVQTIIPGREGLELEF